ncbi:hypothetical protein B0H14DRAFT_2937687, partial [Mycena olivaceomarginata]
VRVGPTRCMQSFPQPYCECGINTSVVRRTSLLPRSPLAHRHLWVARRVTETKGSAPRVWAARFAPYTPQPAFIPTNLVPIHVQHQPPTASKRFALHAAVPSCVDARMSMRGVRMGGGVLEVRWYFVGRLERILYFPGHMPDRKPMADLCTVRRFSVLFLPRACNTCTPAHQHTLPGHWPTIRLLTRSSTIPPEASGTDNIRSVSPETDGTGTQNFFEPCEAQELVLLNRVK